MNDHKKKDFKTPELPEDKGIKRSDHVPSFINLDSPKKDKFFDDVNFKDEEGGFFKDLLDRVSLSFLYEFFILPANALKLVRLANLGSQSISAGLSFAALGFCGTILFFCLFQLFGGVNNFFGPFYPELVNLFQKVDQGLIGRNGMLIGVGSFTALLFGTFAVLYMLESYLDEAWGKITYQTAGQRLTYYWVILTIIPIPFIGTLLFNKNLQIFYYLLQAPVSKLVGSWVIHLLVSALSFSFIYKVFSKGTLNWQSSFAGGIWGAITFEVAKNVFFTLATWQLRAQPIAASFVIIMFIAVLWLTLSAFAFIMGAKIAYVYQHKDVFGHLEAYYLEQTDEAMLEAKELRPLREIALICLLELTRRFTQGPESVLNGPEDVAGIGPSELAKLALIGPERAKEVMGHLHEVGLVTVLHDGPRELAVLRYAPDKITLENFLARIEKRYGKTIPEPLSYSSNKWFWDEYSRAMSERFGHMTLRDLCDKYAQEEQAQTDQSFSTESPDKKIA